MSDNKLLDFNKKRESKIESKRRNFERVLFSDFLGAYSIIDEYGSQFPITMVDVSYEGCMFQVPISAKDHQAFKQDSEVTVRVYFTKGSYIPVVVKVRHGHEYTDEKGYTFMRYGGEFDKSLPSFKAFEKFIDFIYQYAEFSCVDRGEKKVYFL